VIREPSGVERYAKLILRNANELTSMIENVLAFSASRGSNHRSSAPAEEFSVNSILERAVEAVSGEAQEAGCRIEISLTAGLPSLKGDAMAMELAVRNLVLNAARHAASGGWIGVSSSLASKGTALEIRVADRGPGIPESERSRIFEPFYRGSRALSSQTRGTGLGLALVRETVEAHHGEVTVRESSGGGAEFVVRLPLPGTTENRH
jgi:signal transduction histidine kinase